MNVCKVTRLSALLARKKLGMDAMKNLYVRLSVIGCVVALGVGAIAQSLKSSDTGTEESANPGGTVLPAEGGDPTQVADGSNQETALKNTVLLASHTGHENPANPGTVPPIIRGNNESSTTAGSTTGTPTTENGVTEAPSQFKFAPVPLTNPASATDPAATTNRFSQFGPATTPATPVASETDTATAPPTPENRFSSPTIPPATETAEETTPSTGNFQLGGSLPSDTGVTSPNVFDENETTPPAPSSRFLPIVTPSVPVAVPVAVAIAPLVANLAGEAIEAVTDSSIPPAPVSSFSTNPVPPISSGTPSPSYGVTDTTPTYPPTSPAMTEPNPLPLASVASRAPTMTQGNGQPGTIDQEGIQTPSLTLEKFAPAEIQVGKATKFELVLKNVGQADAQQVVVRDYVPQGTRLIATIPVATQAADGALVWELGTVAPGEEKTIVMQLVPEVEGDVGSVASVSFAAVASVKTRVTKPELTLEQSAPGTVLIGDQVTVAITLSNPGTGPATGVILEEVVPQGFTHPAGAELEFEIGTLKPGESRQLNLVMTASQAGFVSNVLAVRGDGNLSTQSRIEVQVIAPELEVTINGPNKRYLERPATYTVSVNNPGTAPTKEIDLVTYLPKGLQFIEANNAGQYDSAKHAVYWNLEELPPAQSGSVELVAMPIETGEQKLRVEGTASMGLESQYEKLVQVEGLAAIFFEVIDKADPIEIGKDTVYEIRVVNQGSKTATNILVKAVLPAGMQGLDAAGATQGQVTPQEIVFTPLAQLAPKADAVFKISAKGLTAGDQRIKVMVSSDDFTQPITKEESTRVYSDN